MIQVGRTQDRYIYKCPLCEKLESYKTKYPIGGMCKGCMAKIINADKKERENDEMLQRI